MSDGQMIRVLFICRYHDATMFRKVELLALGGDPALEVLCVLPRVWQDEFSRVEQTGSRNGQLALAMIGSPSDPHRALYRTLSFGLRRFKPDIVHAEEEPDSLAALQIAAARRVFAPSARLVLNTWQNVGRPLSWAVRQVLRVTLSASDGILCANSEALALLRRCGFTRSAKVLPAIGVDTRVFKPRQEGERVRANESGRFVAGYIGRLVEEKGIDTLVDAVAKLDDVQLRVIGSGPYRANLEDHARRLRLDQRVEFIPAVRPGRIADHMRALDALVLPSRTTRVWKEQFGRVLTEAMACKVPVVGSNSGAIPEVIGDAGLIIPEGDVDALAAALRRLIDSPDLRCELAERGSARVMQHYTQERIAARTAEYYRALLKASG
jgi:glycosyltransferase involved in cell wall biosynthesis